MSVDHMHQYRAFGPQSRNVMKISVITGRRALDLGEAVLVSDAPACNQERCICCA